MKTPIKPYIIGIQIIIGDKMASSRCEFFHSESGPKFGPFLGKN